MRKQWLAFWKRFKRDPDSNGWISRIPFNDIEWIAKGRSGYFSMDDQTALVFFVMDALCEFDWETYNPTSKKGIRWLDLDVAPIDDVVAVSSEEYDQLFETLEDNLFRYVYGYPPKLNFYQAEYDSLYSVDNNTDESESSSTDEEEYDSMKEGDNTV